MTDIWDVSERAGGGEAIVHGFLEEEPASKESKVHDDFIKWISTHEDQVQKVLCGSRDFANESFCGEGHGKMYEDSFLWKGAAP